MCIVHIGQLVWYCTTLWTSPLSFDFWELISIWDETQSDSCWMFAGAHTQPVPLSFQDAESQLECNIICVHDDNLTPYTISVCHQRVTFFLAAPGMFQYVFARCVCMATSLLRFRLLQPPLLSASWATAASWWRKLRTCSSALESPSCRCLPPKQWWVVMQGIVLLSFCVSTLAYLHYLHCCLVWRYDGTSWVVVDACESCCTPGCIILQKTIRSYTPGAKPTLPTR